VSISVLGASLGAIVSASYSTFCNVSLFIIIAFYQSFSDGRKPVYLTAIPLLFLGSFGVASSRTIAQLLWWRFIQSIGASPGLSVGAGVIGDIYKLDERGQATGIFISVRHFTSLSKVGLNAGIFRQFFWDRLWLPLLAVKPILTLIYCCSYFLHVGLAAHYYSWRFMQQFLGLVGFLVFFIIIFFLPETFHPNKRGVDNIDPSLLPKWRPVLLNPLQPLWLLRSPNLLAVVRILFLSAISRT
jgi:predicted MFS family arabinose efflux permease